MAIGERRDPADVIVTVYHHCPTGASGSALGPFNAISYWWAEVSRIRVIGTDDRTITAVQDAVVEHLGGSAADRIRAAQDAAADAVE